jgi:hypothetical protein
MCSRAFQDTCTAPVFGAADAVPSGPSHATQSHLWFESDVPGFLREQTSSQVMLVATLLSH